MPPTTTKAQINLGLSLWLDEKWGSRQDVDELVSTAPQRFANAIAADELSHHLSYAACETAVGHDVFNKVFPAHTLERSRRAIANVSAESDLIDLERALPFKGGLDAVHSVELARHMIKVLREPFARTLEVKNRGGRPREMARRALIFHLAINSTRILGTVPTAYEDGPFLNLCSQVTHYCGVGEAGLHDAVKRTLGDHRKDIDWAGLPSIDAAQLLSDFVTFQIDNEDDQETAGG